MASLEDNTIAPELQRSFSRILRFTAARERSAAWGSQLAWARPTIVQRDFGARLIDRFADAGASSSWSATLAQRFSADTSAAQSGGLPLAHAPVPVAEHLAHPGRHAPISSGGAWPAPAGELASALSASGWAVQTQALPQPPTQLKRQADLYQAPPTLAGQLQRAADPPATSKQALPAVEGPDVAPRAEQTTEAGQASGATEQGTGSNTPGSVTPLAVSSLARVPAAEAVQSAAIAPGSPPSAAGDAVQLQANATAQTAAAAPQVARRVANLTDAVGAPAALDLPLAVRRAPALIRPPAADPLARMGYAMLRIGSSTPATHEASSAPAQLALRHASLSAAMTRALPDSTPEMRTDLPKATESQRSPDATASSRFAPDAQLATKQGDTPHAQPGSLETDGSQRTSSSLDAALAQPATATPTPPTHLLPGVFAATMMRQYQAPGYAGEPFSLTMRTWPPAAARSAEHAARSEQLIGATASYPSHLALAHLADVGGAAAPASAPAVATVIADSLAQRSAVAGPIAERMAEHGEQPAHDTMSARSAIIPAVPEVSVTPNALNFPLRRWPSTDDSSAADIDAPALAPGAASYLPHMTAFVAPEIRRVAGSSPTGNAVDWSALPLAQRQAQHTAFAERFSGLSQTITQRQGSPARPVINRPGAAVDATGSAWDLPVLSSPHAIAEALDGSDASTYEPAEPNNPIFRQSEAPMWPAPTQGASIAAVSVWPGTAQPPLTLHTAARLAEAPGLLAAGGASVAGAWPLQAQSAPIQRTLALPLDLPATTASATVPAAGGMAEPAPTTGGNPPIDELARKVYDYLRRELRVEQERSGLRVW